MVSRSMQQLRAWIEAFGDISLGEMERLLS